MAYWNRGRNVRKITRAKIGKEANTALREKKTKDIFHFIIKNSIYFFSLIVFIRAIKPLLFEASIFDFVTKPAYIHENILLSISILIPLIYHNLRGE